MGSRTENTQSLERFELLNRSYSPYTYGIRYHQIWPGSEYHQLEGFDHGFNPNPQKAVDIAVNYLKRIFH
jgi:hypothetical protein